MAAAGRRRATIRDVADAVGVSITTVSNALNHPELVAPSTRARILEVVEALDYTPNPFAQSLRRTILD